MARSAGYLGTLKNGYTILNTDGTYDDISRTQAVYTIPEALRIIADDNKIIASIMDMWGLRSLSENLKTIADEIESPIPTTPDGKVILEDKYGHLWIRDNTLPSLWRKVTSYNTSATWRELNVRRGPLTVFRPEEL